MRRSLVVVFIALSLTGLSSSASAEETPSVTPLQKTSAYVQPSVAYLDIQWTGYVFDKVNKGYLQSGRPFVLNFSCTGFIVDPDGYIATAGHCVDALAVRSDFLDVAAAWVVKSNYYTAQPNYATARGYAETDYRIEGDSKSAGGAYKKSPDLVVQAVWNTSSNEPIYNPTTGELNGNPVGAKVIKLARWNDGAGDTALLKVEPTNLPALPIATSSEITTNTAIVSVGYPAVVGEVSDATVSEPSFKDGSISSIRTNALFPIYETSAPLSGGMSGGPTVNLQYQVVGVNSYGIEGESQNFSFIQSADTLVGLIQDAGQDVEGSNEVGPVSTDYREGLDAYFAGDKERAVSSFNAALSADPDFVLAKDYLQKSEALPDPSSSQWVVILAIAAAVVLLFLLVGGLIILLRRRNKGESAATAAPAPVYAASPSSTQPTPTNSPSAHNAPTTLAAPPEGTAGAQAAVSTRFCTKCGIEVGDSAYCRACGQKLD